MSLTICLWPFISKKASKIHNIKDSYSFIKIAPNSLRKRIKINKYKADQKLEIFGLLNQGKIRTKAEESLLLIKYTN